jgi:hypothetical protein
MSAGLSRVVRGCTKHYGQMATTVWFEVVKLPTMCLLDGNVEIARLKVAGAVRAMSLWHWKESIVLLGASIDAMVCNGRVYSLSVRETFMFAFRESLRDVSI